MKDNLILLKEEILGDLHRLSNNSKIENENINNIKNKFKKYINEFNSKANIISIDIDTLSIYEIAEELFSEDLKLLNKWKLEFL